MAVSHRKLYETWKWEEIAWIIWTKGNFKGLSSHAKVIEAGKKAMDSHGAGMSSVRFICGTQDIHKALEKKIAEFHGREDAILYAACFDANAGFFEVIASVFSDYSFLFVCDFKKSL